MRADAIASRTSSKRADGRQRPWDRNEYFRSTGVEEVGGLHEVVNLRGRKGRLMMFSDDTPRDHISQAKSGDSKESFDPNRPIATRRRGFLKNFGLAGLALSAGALLTS